MTSFFAGLLLKAFPRTQQTSSPPDETSTHINEVNSNYSSLATEVPAWRPIYLDRRVYAGFIVVFVLLVLALEVLLYISNRNYGLTSSFTGLHYLWTYGPTAMLTLIASFWARVEYQTKSTSPWSRMVKGPALSQHSILLDYVSQFQLFSIYTATKNRDYSVALSSLVSLILRVTIVISTSLIVLSPIEVPNKPVRVTIKEKFIDDENKWQNLGEVAYPTISESFSYNVSLPDGISKSSAYQTVEANSHNISFFETTVDALFADLNCEPANTSYVYDPDLSDYSSIFRLRSMNWDMIVACDNTWQMVQSNNTAIRHGIWMACGSIIRSSDATTPYCDKAGLVVSAIKLPRNHIEGNNVNFTILWANSFICTPTYEIRPTKLIKNGTNTRLSTIPNAKTRQLGFVDNSSFLISHVDVPLIIGGGVAWISGVPIDLDPYMWFWYSVANHSQSNFSFPRHLSSLYSGDSITQLVRSYYQQYVAILARESLMETSSIPSTALAVVSEDRLLMQSTPAQVMAALFLTSIFLIGATWWLHTQVFLPQNPNIIIGLAALLAHNRLPNLTGMGNACFANLKAVLSCCTYQIRLQDNNASKRFQGSLLYAHQKLPPNKGTKIQETEPAKFRPFNSSATSRLLALAFVSSLITILEVLLRKSERETGIADTPTSQNQLQLWTIIPGFLSVLVNIYCGSMDFNTRVQTPLLRLADGLDFEDQLGLDLLDRHTSTLIYAEIQTRSFKAIASTIALITTSFLTIFSASLFYTATIPAEYSVQLHAKSFIYYSLTFPPNITRLGTGIPILLENASYPAFTYEDLIFPGLKLERETAPDRPAQSNARLQMTIPAIRTSFSRCKLYDPSEIKTSLTQLGENTIFDIYVQPEMGCLRSRSFSYITDPRDPPGNIYFGSTHPGCSWQLWIWGHWSNKSRSISTSALGCNDTLQSVNALVVFDSQTMVVDTTEPPNLNLSTVTELDSFPQVSAYEFYLQELSYLGDPGGSTSFDNFFAILINSRYYAVPITYLGDSTKSSAVANAIQFHHKILVAQYMNNNYRYANTSTAQIQGKLYNALPGWNEATVVNATAKYPARRDRVIQDAVSTRILQSLLAITLICIVTNWYLMRNADILPRSPTTIANWLAFLADGNLNDFMPLNAAQMPLEELSRWYFGQNARFYLGYRESPETGDQVFGIYVTNEDPTRD
ncbi:hypothetical protein CIB48_g4738 [Xylaria polymorpha]|nr:hypothetical protein CIB48_g4738 [Xylaria polymorpha]